MTKSPRDNTVNIQHPQEKSLWGVYVICLFISAIYFFLFGFNSPIYTFNTEHDYNWYMTIGHGMVAGKLPYRDLFEHKGPIVYFVTAFCCLFQHPNLIILIFEIFSMSLFFFFSYRIARKRLNTFYSFITISVLALAIFTSRCRICSAATVEEFCLPIYAYFLLCWLEYTLEHRTWSRVRALCLGLCFGIIFWVKFTLFYFMLVPMVIWFVISLRAHEYRTIISNLCMMLLGAIIISVPSLVFYAINHALSDLFHVYFVINLTSYSSTAPETLWKNLKLTFKIGALVLSLITWGVLHFTIHYWRKHTGWLLLIAFLVNWGLLILSAKGIIYYFNGLFPYAILGCVEIFAWLQDKLKLPRYHKLIGSSIALACLVICLPFSILISEWGRPKEDYTPLVIADVIHDYENTNHTQITLFCYKIVDFGFYNATGIIPNNYFFCNNSFSQKDFPEMYQAYHDYITRQTSDFIITKAQIWQDEHALLSEYYQPYTDTIYHYHQLHYYYYRDIDFILLIKKS